MQPDAVFMAIKPAYAEAILAGEKTVELRTRRLDVPVGTPIVIYASGAVGRIVGVVEFVGVLSGTPESLWDRVRSRAGIPKADYDDYFSGRRKAFAIEVRNPRGVVPYVLPWRAQPGWKFLDRRDAEHGEVLAATGLLIAD